CLSREAHSKDDRRLFFLRLLGWAGHSLEVDEGNRSAKARSKSARASSSDRVRPASASARPAAILAQASSKSARSVYPLSANCSGVGTYFAPSVRPRRRRAIA